MLFHIRQMCARLGWNAGLFSVILLTLLTACQTAVDEYTAVTPTETAALQPVENTPSGNLPAIVDTENRSAIPFETISQNSPLGDGLTEPVYAAVTAVADWSQLAIPEKAQRAGEKSSAKLFLIAYAGVKGSSGYQIEIQSVKHANNTLVVTIAETKPEPNAVVEPATTQPYHIVAIDQLPAELSGEITLRFETAANELLAELSLQY